MSKVSDNDTLRPLPTSGYAHCVLLFPEAGDYLQTFLKALEFRLPGVDPIKPDRWAVQSEPRSISFGEVTRGAWKWHLVIDPGGMPEAVAEAVADCHPDEQVGRAVDGHHVCVLAFLLEAPEETNYLEKMRGLCEVAWAWMDAGAEAVFWPEGRTAHLARNLVGLAPQHLESGHSYLFVSNGVDRIDRAGSRRWLRTYGMAQFGLPDLCSWVETNQLMDESLLTNLRLLFETLPPSMIESHGILPLGGKVQVQDQTMESVAAPDFQPPMASRYGFCYFQPG